MKTVRIATRTSALALWQTQHVKTHLQKCYPDWSIQLVEIITTGDKIQDKPLTDIGGKGLFIKALEQALLDGQADIAVHSMKDVPAALDPQFTIAAMMERTHPFDVLVSPHFKTIAALPIGATVGTSSPRRYAQLKAYRPDLNIQPLRGNVDTRIKKCLSGGYDAIILAHAGLERLGLTQHIQQILAAEQMLPAAGQGVIGIECLSHNTALIAPLQSLNHLPTAAAVTAERALVAALNGDCHSAIGALAQWRHHQLELQGLATYPPYHQIARVAHCSDSTNPVLLGQHAAQSLLTALQSSRES